MTSTINNGIRVAVMAAAIIATGVYYAIWKTSALNQEVATVEVQRWLGMGLGFAVIAFMLLAATRWLPIGVLPMGTRVLVAATVCAGTLVYQSHLAPGDPRFAPDSAGARQLNEPGQKNPAASGVTP
ncbi:hypothetical protein CDN99_21415 [Roseateles aquatilis]|uniref:Uncharacterized protein n=1 Tax=Roseateles aquatilis TaxID=431061 RepID=A0A246IZ91_9BURK|nr:hypothetical protein [Roseateles aquatilis]OWQ85647.1 hypothetical protein CDN99_21415 [Roseateles aquatilis]